MKQLLNIALLITLFSCKAQTIIVPIGSGEYYEKNPDYYKKDVNNEFGKFEGTWKYQNGNTQIIFKLKKETHYQTYPDSNYQDLLVGEYQYIENGAEIVNTLSDFSNPSVLGYSHKISGGTFKHTVPGNCTDDSAVAEIKIGDEVQYADHAMPTPMEHDGQEHLLLQSGDVFAIIRYE